MAHRGCSLSTAQSTDFKLKSALVGVTPQLVHIGTDPQEMALEVVCVDVELAPSRDALNRIYVERHGRGLTPHVVAASSATTTWIFGPNPESPTLELPKAQALRILQEALNETNQFAATQRLAQLRQALTSSDDLGIANSGLFANHHLRHNLTTRADWNEASSLSAPMLGIRGHNLIQALGFTESQAGHDATVLKPGSTGQGRAIAILLKEEEQFEAHSHRFNLSPIAYGLSVAARNEVPWLMVLRGSQMRLYPAKDGVGVGQRSQAETYFELDLSLLPQDRVGLLSLVFSAQALAVGGTVDDLLKGSARFATDLGTRLRTRIYEHVVPDLARGVAAQLPNLGMPVNADTLGLAYRLTLRILFRLLFQAYAEDRGLLPYERNERFTANALKTLVMRDLIPNSTATFDGNSSALWDDLAQVWKVIDGGDSAWNIPAYNGGLFGQDPARHGEGAIIARLSIPNDVLGPVLKHMLVDSTDEGTQGPVDFRSLSVREFGTIYEGLLESSLSLADTDLTLDASGTWVPAKPGETVKAEAGTPYFHNASGERKATGSYFTPSIIVEHLLDKALEPALANHLARITLMLDADRDAAAAEAFFDFRVADLAMGSAHFLVAAVDRIETAFRNYLVEHPIGRVKEELNRLAEAARVALGSDAEFAGDIDDALLLRRQIARRCIYGIDINEMAVELGRLALWIHTFVPGLPMSSLDHGLVCANSLTGIGSVEEAIEALDPQSQGTTLFSQAILDSLSAAKVLLIEAGNADEANKKEILETRELADRAKKAAEPTRHIFDAAVAARLGVISAGTFFTSEEIVEAGMQPEVIAAIVPLRPAHMPYLFPEVFMRENPGFDVLLGNPPWEKIKIEEHQWWGLRMPGLRGFPMAQRSTALVAFKEARPDLVNEYEAEVMSVNAQRKVLLSGPFPGLGSGGDADLYQAFGWRNWQLLRRAGFMGVLLPRGAHSGSGMKLWRDEILRDGSFSDVTFASNGGHWMFENVDSRYSVGMTAVQKEFTGDVSFCGPVFSKEAFLSGALSVATVPVAEFTSWSNSSAFPLVPDAVSAEIFRQMRHHPTFGQIDTGWEFRPYAELHATQDRALFSTDLTDTTGKIPVLAGASFNLWNPDFGDYFALADEAPLRAHLWKKLEKASTLPKSAYFGYLGGSLSNLPLDHARVAFRDIARGSDSRTTLACLLPPGVVNVHNAPLLVRRAGTEQTEAFLLGLMSSIPFDWYARKWVELHLTFELLNGMPVPRPAEAHPLRIRLTEIAGRLAAIDDRYTEWASAVGVPTGSVKTETEKDELIGEIDALAFLLYGLDEQQVIHVFETFHKGAYDATRLARVQKYFAQGKAQS